MNTQTKPGVLAVMGREAEAKAAMAAKTRSQGDRAALSSDARQLREARATVERLAEALDYALRFIANLPTDSQLDAVMQKGGTGRDAWAKGTAALAAFRGEQA